MEERVYPVNNYFLYSISHPGKKGVPLIDLSEDPEAHIEEQSHLTDKQRAVERVILKTFAKYGITATISERIRVSFRNKLWRMGETLSKLGGSKRLQLLEDWKHSDWPLKVEVPGPCQLLRQKRRLEEKLETEVSKRRKLEIESASLKKQVHSLDKISRDQAKTIVTLKTGKSRKRGSSKSWSSYSQSHQSVKRKTLVGKMKAALSFCDEHFTPLSVNVENVESGKKQKVDLTNGTFTSYNEDSLSSDDLTHFALYVKDHFNLSDLAYRELSQLTPSLPRLYKLRELSEGLNSTFDISTFSDGLIGVQQSLQSRLQIRLQQLGLKPDEVIDVKLTGDGTYIAKHIHVVNIAFTVLNEGSLASSPFGNHSLAILQVPENYSSLSSALSDIVEEARNLQSIEVGGHQHEIRYFLGGDMKFLAIVCGIESATARYSCVWCKCPSEQRFDMTKEWSAFDTTHGARTIDEIKHFTTLPKTRRTGCQAKPIFDFIPIDRVIIDILHLYLRVTDLLINLFIEDLRRQDGILKSTVDRNKHTNVTNYEKFLNEECKIHFSWYTSKDTKQLKWRDLSGPEKIRLFNHINIPKQFPNIPEGSVIQDIWTEFSRLFKELEKRDVNYRELQEDVKTWVKLFLRVYQTKNVTPYVHSFAFHVPEFINKYGSICQFTQQGLEKLNDVTTLDFLRSTNHRNLEALKQVLQKRNRLEELADNGFKRTTRSQHCSVCGQASHNKRSCPSRSPLSEEQQNTTS